MAQSTSAGFEPVPHWEFRRLVQRHGLDSGRLKFTPWEHFLALYFTQLTLRKSLRDIEACLGAQSSVAYQIKREGCFAGLA